MRKLIKIIGLCAVLAYMIVILGIWIYANLNGYIYFSAGESNTNIKYIEWFFGIIGIITVSSTIKELVTDKEDENKTDHILRK